MLANVLRSDTVIQMSITLVKTFVKLRKIIASNIHRKVEIEQIKNYIQHRRFFVLNKIGILSKNPCNLTLYDA